MSRRLSSVASRTRDWALRPVTERLDRQQATLDRIERQLQPAAVKIEPMPLPATDRAMRIVEEMVRYERESRR